MAVVINDVWRVSLTNNANINSATLASFEETVEPYHSEIFTARR